MVRVSVLDPQGGTVGNGLSPSEREEPGGGNPARDIAQEKKMRIQDIDDPVNPNVTYTLVYTEADGTVIYAENNETGEVYCTKDWGASWYATKITEKRTK